MKSVCSYVLVFIVRFVCGQYSITPCPGVFDFENGVNGPVRGMVTVVKSDDDHRPVSVLTVRINYTIVGPIIDDYRGHITANTVNLVRKYNNWKELTYRVHFPATELPPPKVTAVIINGDTTCNGPGDDEKETDKPITRISIRHRASDGNYKPVTSRPVIDSAVTNPGQNDNMPASKPTVSASPDHYLSTTIITGYECGVISGGNERVPLINNGNFYERGEVPWLVAIYRIVDNNLLFICGGTLVSDRHIVTAAHCMRRPFVVTPITDIVVKVGVHSLNAWDDNVTVIRKLMAGTIHDDYDPKTLQNDILILTLDKRVKFNRYIRPACLWSGDTELSRVVGASGVVAGWGAQSVDSVGGKQDEPQMVRVPIVSTKECKASKSDFHRLTYDTTLCAGDRNGAGPCKGDSGGGLFLLDDGKWRLRGVVSLSVQSENGALTCNLNEYVVYTDTAQFLQWIRNILSQNYYD